MKTTKILATMAFAASMAFWAASCGGSSDGYTEGGEGGGSGGHGTASVKSQTKAKADEVTAVLDSIDAAVAADDQEFLAAHGISPAEAADADLLVMAKARVIDGLHIAGLDGECGVSAECLAEWVDSMVYNGEEWENSGDGEYDQACRMVIDVNGTCEEYAWKFLDAEAMAFGNTACNELYETAGNLGMASNYIKVEAGRCKKKTKCTIQTDQAPEERGFLHAIYGYTKEACGEAEPSSSSSAGKSSASGAGYNYDACIRTVTTETHCTEYCYDSHDSNQQTWAQQMKNLPASYGVYEDGLCDTSDYPVACDPHYEEFQGGAYVGVIKIVEHVNNIGWCHNDDEEDDSGEE